MYAQECRGCGFKVISDEPVPETGDWLCRLCAEKAETAPVPSGDLAGEQAPLIPGPAAPPPPGCPACGGPVVVGADKHGKRVRCPSCGQALAVGPTGEISEYDQFQEFLKKKAEANRTRIMFKSAVPDAARPNAAAADAPQGAAAEEPEDAPQVSFVLLFVLLAIPLFGGLVPAFWTAAMRKLQVVANAILPILGQ